MGEVLSIVVPTAIVSFGLGIVFARFLIYRQLRGSGFTIN